jgi:hypothetical protein
MKLFLCQSGGHRVVVAAMEADRAREICAAAEIENLKLEALDPEEAAENLKDFMEGWRAMKLTVPKTEGIRLAWWQP